MNPIDRPREAVRRPLRPRPHEWLLIGAGLVLTNHYAWLLDDAFVYFRYVDNWVIHGYGLVFNAGEYVEGFTSPAWTLLLGLLRSTGLDYWHIVRLLGLLAFGAFGWMLLRLDRDLSPAPRPGEDEPLGLNFPLAYLTLHYGVLCYFTSGMEAPIVQLCAVGYALHLVRPERPLPTLLVGLSPIVRPELTLAFALTFAWSWLRSRRLPWRLALVGAVAGGGWLLFRIVYYADLMPNTFYLKDLSDWAQGGVYLHETLSTYWVYPLAAGFALLALLLRRRGVAIDAAPRLAMLIVAGAVALYFVRVGGDPRHYRYLAFSFCLATCALAGLLEHGVATFAPRFAHAPNSRRWAFALGLGIAIAVATRYPPQLAAHPIRGDVPHRMLNKINDAAYHRNHPSLAISPWSLDTVLRQPPTPLGGRGYQGVTNSGWCEWIYRLPNMRVIHNLGLTDAILARVEMAADRPAHKSGLQPLAAEIEELHRLYTPAPGMYRMAIEDGRASGWMVRNLESIEIIERKIYNRHHLLENLRLALSFPPRIEP